MNTDEPQERRVTDRLKVGDRVQLSELGRLHPKIVDRKGRIVSVSKNGSYYRVLWDGLKTPAAYHHTYIEIDADS